MEGSVTRLVLLQEAALAEVADHPDEDDRHDRDDRPEGAHASLERKVHVHPEHAREERQRQDDHAERGQHAQHLVDAVREHGLVRVLERLDHFLEVLEHVPDALRGVDDVVEVDLEVLREVALFRALQVAQHRALRADHLAEVDDLLLRVRDIAHDLLGAALEDVLLQPLELVADLPQHREAVVEGVVDDLVEQVAAVFREHVLAYVAVGAAALEQVFDRRDRRVRERDHEVWPDEDVELGGVEASDRLVEDREVQDDEEVVLVLVDLRALVAGEDVLVVERVELEVLLEPGSLGGTGPLDVDPAEPVPLDGLDARLSRL